MIRKKMSRALFKTLILFFQVDPQRGLTTLLLGLFFLILVNLASNSLTNMLVRVVGDWPLVVAPLVLVAFGALWWLFTNRSERGETPTDISVIGTKPQPHSGLIWMLSTPDRKFEAVRAEVEERIKGPSFDGMRAYLLDKIKGTNLEPAIQAIRHHSQQDRLARIWLIATEGERGSARFRDTFIDVCCATLGIEASMFVTKVGEFDLVVSDTAIDETFRAVQRIYENAASFDIAPDDIMADITGGRATMSTGMALFCVPSGYPMEYTSTTGDPGQPHSEWAEPRAVQVDAADVLLMALESIRRSKGAAGVQAARAEVR